MMNCENCLFQSHSSTFIDCHLCSQTKSLNEFYIAGMERGTFFPMLSGFKSEDQAKSLLGKIKLSGVDAHLLKWNSNTSAYISADA